MPAAGGELLPRCSLRGQISRSQHDCQPLLLLSDSANTEARRKQEPRGFCGVVTPVFQILLKLIHAIFNFTDAVGHLGLGKWIRLCVRSCKR